MSGRMAGRLVTWGLLAALVGCGGGPEIAAVSGVITLDGEPLEGAHINTQPRATKGSTGVGIGSFGVTDSEGRYTLELTQPPKPGAVVGTHTVRIKSRKVKYLPGQEDRAIYQASRLPGSATDGSLTLTVPSGGTDEADFAFESEAN